ASIGKCSAPCVGRISETEHRKMCENIVGVLTGSIGKSYVAQLTRDMKQASAELEFEKAAKLRDQIQALQGVIEQNAVVLDQHVDADFFGVASDELEASVHGFFVRDGIIRGERNWSVERVENVEDSELLSDLLVHYYCNLLGMAAVSQESVAIHDKRDGLSSNVKMTAVSADLRAQATKSRNAYMQQTGRNDSFTPIAPIPREIIVPFLPARSEELETLFSQMRGSLVNIRAVERGDKKALLQRANENASLALARSKLSRISDIGARTQAMNDVAQALGLEQAPLRIECYDISNASGGAFQVASMVVFEDGVAKKQEYRRFAIRGDDGKGAVDDISAMYETISRRFKHGNVAGDSGESIEHEQSVQSNSGKPAKSQTKHFAYKPNLIVVDGGKAQVDAAYRAMHDCNVFDVAVCGLAKRLEEVWVHDDDYPIIMSRQSEGMYLLQRVRDESHRFAITYHRSLRRKASIHSALDDIEGIGPSYQKKLLKHFGSIRAIRQASIDELCNVSGIGEKKAKTIYEQLHNSQETPKK
ncbi:MAG: excinuclease ABC subunit UvrC, partial [Bifidobacteriaceae bacterium]|nr:excinuclease ABC subunit UvrC [Bifidobacteriaceae bacterium]